MRGLTEGNKKGGETENPEGGHLEWEGQTLSVRVAFELITELRARHGGAS